MPSPGLTNALTALSAGAPTPTPSPTFTSPVKAAEQACASGATLCTLVTDATGSSRAGLWVQALVGTPLQVALIVVLGLLARWLAHRVIDRVAEGIATGRAGLSRLDHRLPTATAILSTNPLSSDRRQQRARTTASVLKSITTGIVLTVVALMVLSVVGLPITPILTGAGILGLAVGFGAQTLVKDFLSGLFMIVEDQYGVGDVVDLGEGSGVVEAVGLRVTRLRDTDGTVWYIRNGEVLRVGNRSQGWARAVLDVGIDYGEDVDRAQALLLDVAQRLRDDDHFGPLVLDEPEVWGIESVSAEGVVVRLVVKTKPMEQWAVARELRRRIKERFDDEGVRVAYRAGAVWFSSSPPPSPAAQQAAQPADPAAAPAAAPAVAPEIAPEVAPEAAPAASSQGTHASSSG